MTNDPNPTAEGEVVNHRASVSTSEEIFFAIAREFRDLGRTVPGETQPFSVPVPVFADMPSAEVAPVKAPARSSRTRKPKAGT